MARKLEVLDRHCAEVGRDPAEIERTTIVDLDAVGDPDGFLAAMERYAAVGITKVWVVPAGPDPAGWTAQVVEAVLPRLLEV